MPDRLWRGSGGDRDPRRCVCVEWGTGAAGGGGGGAIIPNSYYTVTTRMISALRKTGSDVRHFPVPNKPYGFRGR